MEKLDTSLDHLLEKKEQLPLSVKLRILFDVSKGLVYLHGRVDPIVHRDLTTRNVLINKDSMSAKIADLGNARIIDKTMLSHTLTQVPGTPVYMPPEALGTKPNYSTSLDVFSFGHLTLYTITQVFPGGLLSPTYFDPHSNELHARSEVDRRGEYMTQLYDQLGKGHAVTRLVEHCLSNRKERRPTAKYIMDELKRLIELQCDPFSVYSTASRLTLVNEISRKSEPRDGNLPGSNYKYGGPGILEIERSKGNLLSKKLVWKQYIFQVQGTVFHYVKGSKVVEAITLNSITSVQTGPPVEGRFSFSILFIGKGSPWNLRASTEEERDRWTNILRYSRMPGTLINRQGDVQNYAKPYEVPVSTISGMQRGKFPSGASFKPPAVMQEATPPPLYEDINDKLTEAHKKRISLQENPTGAFPHLYDDTVNSKQSSQDMKCKDSKHQVPTPEETTPLYQDIEFADLPKKTSKNPTASLKPEIPMPTPEYQVPPSPSEDPEYQIPPSSFEDQQYEVPPSTSPVSSNYDYYDYTLTAPKETGELKQDLQDRDMRAASPSLYYHDVLSGVHGNGEETSEPPIPPPRRHSSQSWHQNFDDATYTPMEAIQSQLQHQKNAADNSPQPRNRVTSTSSTSDNLPFSLEDLTKEQLLSYVQIIQSSQLMSYMQPDYNSQEPPSTSHESGRSHLYMNIMTADFQNPVSDVPPPLPPRTFIAKSSEDLGMAPPIVPRKKAAIPKSHSVLLQGSSAEAVRQRYEYKRRDDGGHVQFKLAEEDKGDVFIGQRYKPTVEHEQHYPPVPPRLHSVSDADPLQQSDCQYMERQRPNIPQRSHTMKLYLPSATKYRQKYTYPKGADHIGDQQLHRQAMAPPSHKQQNQTRNRHTMVAPSQQTKNPDILEVQSMLGNVLMNAKKMSSDRYLNIMEREEEEEEDRPEWATCMPSLNSSNQAFTPEESLESLQRLALFIDKADLNDMHQIGRGQFGKVYMAKLSRGTAIIDVAVKTIKRYESEKERAEFLREQAIMSQMAHPNVVRLYGLVQQESPWIVLEFLPNGDLKHFLAANKKPTKTLLKYMLDVALGMHYISEKGLVHRDIAARNIMVSHDEVCKVGDFGLLRELPKDEEIYVSVTKSPAPIRWMAPESLERREFSTASDVWSYGVLLWEICQPTKLPYEGMDNYQCGLSVIQGRRLDIPFVYPSRVKKIMKACWHQIPAKRPSFLLIFNILTLIIFS